MLYLRARAPYEMGFISAHPIPMADLRVRRDVARVAARLMYERTEKEYFTAKRKAARMLGLKQGTFFRDLPSNAEIRDEIEVLARMHEGEQRTANLRAMRLEGLRLLRVLSEFRPRLIGSVLTGHIRTGSDIDIHVFSDSEWPVTEVVEGLGLHCEVEHKRVVKHHEARVFTHVHVQGGRFPIELTVYAEDKTCYVFRSSITGRPIERANARELESLLVREEPGLDVEAELVRLEVAAVDRFEVYRSLLLPLEAVKQNPRHHPEGDALYHSLQVFELARDARPYDEELMLAALLHDVGKAIDPGDHVGAGLRALDGAITERTRWLIEHHMEALEVADGTIGQRALRRLREHEDFEDLMLLREFDSAGRRGGVVVCSVDEALEFVRGLEEGWGSDA